MRSDSTNTRIVQITAGRGPAECCLVVSKVLPVFCKEAKTHGLVYEELDRQKGPENRTLQSVVLSVKGAKSDTFLAGWLGTIQWIGTSPYRKFHKRKNWFIGIFSHTPAVQTAMRESDLKFQAMRSSGPGGQHVNKTNSAVRVTHIPTGLSVQVMESRSQHQNRKIAVQRIKEKLDLEQWEQLRQEAEQQWENHLSLTRGNPIRIFREALR